MESNLTRRLNAISGNDAARIYGKIAKIDEFKGWFKAAPGLGPQILGSLKQSTIVSSVGSSTRIEGSKMSDEQVKKLLNGLKVSRLKDRDSQEVAGYAELLETIFDNYNQIQITENIIFGFHDALLKFSEKDKRHKGRYKFLSNAVVARDNKGNESVIFNPTEPYLAQKETRELIDWAVKAYADGIFHPLLIAANFNLEFLSIHPFQDGNGRLSRAVLNLMLLKSGYSYARYASLEKIIEDNKASYYLALRKSQMNRGKKAENIIPWLDFILDVLVKHAETVKETVQGENPLFLISEKHRAILELFEKYETITNKIIVSRLKMNRETAGQSLARLVKLKLIKKTGSGRATAYINMGNEEKDFNNQ
ncbi:MAG: Fic family protein [Candidatus Goldiibacteriota bacterium HGW-Goldbacteria-1]|jgi:Fic family protein|nr:MAG: Fic family protein [Candidatus Goldiibacteriota bacterium HGW-Goldbacteria-1]